MFGDKHYSEVVRLMKDCDPKLRPQVEAAAPRLNDEGSGRDAVKGLELSERQGRGVHAAGAAAASRRVRQGWSAER